MRRTAMMLLQHGPLTVAEFTEITGWSYSKASRMLAALWSDGMLVRVKHGTYAIKE
jgi:DNA-binding IclR family transcriptional regulator